MQTNQSPDLYIQIHIALLTDVQTLLSDVFTPNELLLTIERSKERYAREGMGFLTKTLPMLGKALDQALSSKEQKLTPVEGFQKRPGSELPVYLGELFSLVFDQVGAILPSPSDRSVKHIRQICYLFYKLELPYSASTKQAVLDGFRATEAETAQFSHQFTRLGEFLDGKPANYSLIKTRLKDPQGSPGEILVDGARLIRDARRTLFKLFAGFDPKDIIPRHGPGCVSTKEELNQKYQFTRLNPRIDEVYPYDEYFCSSLGHVCDTYRGSMQFLSICESFAKVVLVPKDSRGPRLISEEPLENQWVQQGLNSAIVDWVEHHALTRDNVHFTDQGPNRRGAFLGSLHGRYATLDLKDASDRVSLGLVRLLWPSHIVRYLEACRSLATQMPNRSILKLEKYAPMGSALCFSVLAVTIWAILRSSMFDQDARESILVYGDDVIVKTAKAAHAIQALEVFGLKINQTKSCIHGLFRESCGLDAFKGLDVTPVRIKTEWSHLPAASPFVSYIEYSNSFYKRGYRQVSEKIAEAVQALYGPVPSSETNIDSSCSLTCIPENSGSFKVRFNKHLQRREMKVPVVRSRSILRGAGGWRGLLRYFTEGGRARSTAGPTHTDRSGHGPLSQLLADEFGTPFSIRRYTRRDEIEISWRWRRVC